MPARSGMKQTNTVDIADGNDNNISKDVVKPAKPPAGPISREEQDKLLDEALDESFPASDPISSIRFAAIGEHRVSVTGSSVGQGFAQRKKTPASVNPPIGNGILWLRRSKSPASPTFLHRELLFHHIVASTGDKDFGLEDSRPIQERMLGHWFSFLPNAIARGIGVEDVRPDD